MQIGFLISPSQTVLRYNYVPLHTCLAEVAGWERNAEELSMLLRRWEIHFHYLKTAGGGGCLHRSLRESVVGCVCCAIAPSVLVCCEGVHACAEARVWYPVSSSMVSMFSSWNRVSHWLQSWVDQLTSKLWGSWLSPIPQNQDHRYARMCMGARGLILGPGACELGI